MYDADRYYTVPDERKSDDELDDELYYAERRWKEEQEEGME